MDKRFQGIKVLIWDFDGTLYKPNQELFAAVRQAEYKTIMTHTGWSYEDSLKNFESKYKKVTPSATETVALLCHITTSQAAIDLEQYFDRRKFLYKDQKLIELFRKLKSFRHFILANGVRKNLEDTLKVLGLDKNIFSDIVTSETVGVNKPHQAGFKYILGETGLPPQQHLMIGDREKVDLVPAKELGIKTCLVFSESTDNVADITLPAVYELEKVLS